MISTSARFAHSISCSPAAARNVICRCEHHLLALVFQFSGQLSDTRRLSDSVYADHQNDRLSVFKFISRLSDIHLLLDAVDQKLLAGRRILDATVFYLSA